jgi:hypothetical protein
VRRRHSSNGIAAGPPPRPNALNITSPLINLLVVIMGLAAAYFVTIQSIKVELAAKAEGAVVATLDKRLTRFEVLLTEGVVSKEEFHRFSRDIEARLIRIENYLTENPGR